jgi:serine/threonine protein kinase
MLIAQFLISVHDFPQVAIKTIKKSKIETEADLIRIRREIQIMSSVQHPNIIHIYEGKIYCYFCF